jgi:hypothetical protein
MDEARLRIRELRARGEGWRTVARTLNAEGVPTPSGRGQWHDTTAAHHHEPERWSAYMGAYRARPRP